MVMASMTEKGSPSSTERSINAPGSPSSALQQTYFTPSSLLASYVNCHFMPVEKPAPPRPRRPDFFQAVDDLLGRRLLSENAFQSGVAVHAQVLVDGFGIDDAAVAQGDAQLLVVEGVSSSAFTVPSSL